MVVYYEVLIPNRMNPDERGTARLHASRARSRQTTGTLSNKGSKNDDAMMAPIIG